MNAKPNSSTYSPQDVVNILDQCIHIIINNISCYSRDAVSDFTRKRKLPPDVFIRFILQMQSKGVKSELSDFFTSQPNLPADSTFFQQRGKFLPAAFYRLLYLFNNSFQNFEKWQGYHILACDGSDVISHLIQMMKKRFAKIVLINHIANFMSMHLWTLHVRQENAIL